jgi:hypothetical protein
MKMFFYWKFIVPYQMFVDKKLMPRLRGQKSTRLPICSSKFWGKRLQEMQFGQLVLGKATFVINITILLKVFDAPTWSYFVGLITITFLLWWLGFILDKYGVRKHYRDAEFKDVKLGK